MRLLTHLSLCSGIGGIDIAAEWAGFETVGQCEIDEYASRVLAKNFKGVHNFHDIRTITDGVLRGAGVIPETVTVMSAGFPCQPYSLAGKGLGDGDERDLWGEVARCIGLVRPKWFVGENTPGLFARANQRYFRRIVNDLSALGYSTSWGMWGACDVGAPHKRERVFLVARDADGKYDKEEREIQEEGTYASRVRGEVPDPLGQRFCKGKIQRRKFAQSCRKKDTRGIQIGRLQSFRVCSVLPDSACKRLWNFRSKIDIREKTSGWNDNAGRKEKDDTREWWEIEPDVGRVANGIPSRVDRLRCLGNAVVPQQVYPIFRAIAELEGETK